jgi:hypothetical protein
LQNLVPSAAGMENLLQELAVLAARTVDGGVISVSGEPPQPGPFGSH